MKIIFFMIIKVFLIQNQNIQKKLSRKVKKLLKLWEVKTQNMKRYLNL